MLIHAIYQIRLKYCTPVMFDLFVCPLFSFCAHDFPTKSEIREPGKVIVELTSYSSWKYLLWGSLSMWYDISFVARNNIFSLKWWYYGLKGGILDYCRMIIYFLRSYYILSKDKVLYVSNNGHGQDTANSLVSVEYANTTIPVNTLVFIVQD